MSDEPKPVPYDPIIVHIGNMGSYQFWFFILIASGKFLVGWVCLTHIFLAAPTLFTCIDPVGVDPCSSNCSKAEHNRTIFRETIVTEFGLVCNKAWLSSMTQTFVMLGIMLGNMAFGVWADKQGRKRAYLCALMCAIIFSFLVSAARPFFIYSLVRFLCAFATGGMMGTGYVLIIEILAGNPRQVLSLLYHLPHFLGFAMLPIFAYFYRDWRIYNLSYSIVGCSLLVSICLVIESPRWLFSTGRLDESIALLERIARIQGKPTENIRSQIEADYRQKIAKSEGHKGKMSELFKTPNLRKKTIVSAYLWLTFCMVYYGVSQYISLMAGDIFWNVSASAGLAALGPIIGLLTCQFLGRRSSLIIAYLGSGICLVIIAFTPKDYTKLAAVLGGIGVFGSSFIACVVYLHSSELFPTVVRSSAVGLCSMVGRIGAMIAPHISDLGRISITLPPTIFGAMSIIGGLLTFLLPETKGYSLPETIEDGENFGKKPVKTS